MIMTKGHGRLYNLARKLALALADEAMYLEGYGEEGPSENTLNLLSMARDELNLADEFDDLDSLKRLTPEEN